MTDVNLKPTINKVVIIKYSEPSKTYVINKTMVSPQA